LNDTAPQRQVSTSLLAAGANDPELLRPVLEFNKTLFSADKGSKQRSPQSIAVLLGATGLWFMEAFQVSPLSPTQRRRVIKELLAMADRSDE